MVLDIADGSSFNMDNELHMDADIEEPPNPEAQKFYDMLRAADNELWPGCSKHSQLSLVARMINLKSENNISEKCFDGFAELMKEIVPDDNLVPDNFYKTKRLLRGMGLPVLKIDCCYHNCMLYWKHDIDLDQCRICGYSRYDMRNKKRVAKKRMYYFPLTPRLQRLYASNATAAHMHWHASSVDDGVMRHPADSPAWKHLDNTFPDFGAETRNVRLGLSTDGFQPFGQTGKQYSSWPVVLTPYNLPPWMCMKEQFMFLTVLVPGPQNPKEKLDVFLQPLIEELCELWYVGAYWDTDAAKAVSERAKKNRLSEPDGPGTGVAKHRGGSRSAVAYSYQMARDKGVSIKDTIFPTFKKLHFSERDNTWTSGKAKRIAEEVDAELEDLTQDGPDGVSPTPAETSSIFVGIAQHPVKNRVFGVGSLFSVPSVQSRWEGGGDEMPSVPSDSTLRAELDVVRSKFEAAEKAREAAEKAREDEIEGVRSQLEASEKAREDMERRQDLLKELYQEQQQEHQQLRQTLATQQQVLEQLLRERNTPPPDM